MGVEEAEAGYSGTPLATKLGLKEGHTLVLIAAPPRWSVPGMPATVRVSRCRSASRRPARADIVVAFFREARRLEREAPLLAAGLEAGCALWVAWPRRAGGHYSDITENLLRDVLLPVGVVDVKVAALDTDWSGLKFVWRKSSRPSGPGRT